MQELTHQSVLLEEVVSALQVKAGGTYVDGTLGRAGHARAILTRAGEGATFLGLDRDAQAIEASREKLRPFAETVHLHLVRGCHHQLASLAHAEGICAVDGVLLDLGVSSPQLDDASRGFSFRLEGPLDMRMDPSQGECAAEIVATRTEDELTSLIRTWGEERGARAIARAIVRTREKEPIQTTVQLADLVVRAIGWKGAHHPATRTFQALRMVVNHEMEELEGALKGGLDLLVPGGRLVVITFESLTDRVVKQFFQAHAGKMVSLQQGGAQWEGEYPRVRLPMRHPVVACEEELKRNPRARSAKMRVAERM